MSYRRHTAGLVRTGGVNPQGYLKGLLTSAPVAGVAPVLKSIFSGGKTTTMIYDSALVRGSVATGNFVVKLAGTPITVDNVFVSNNAVTIYHWSNAITTNQTVTVDYNGSTVISRDTGGLAGSFTAHAVTTGPASTNNTATTTWKDNPYAPTINPNTYAKRGSTATGTPGMIIGLFHTHPLAALAKTFWFEAADRYGLCVVILDGSDGYATAGETPHVYTGHASWILSRIPTWATAIGASTSRVYVTGQSAGASMSYFLTLQYPESTFNIKGMAPVDINFTPALIDSPQPRVTPYGLFQTWGGSDTTALPNAPTSGQLSEDQQLALATTAAGTSGSALITNSVGVLTQKSYEGNILGQIVTGGKHFWPGDPGSTDSGDLAFTMTDMVAQWVLAQEALLT